MRTAGIILLIIGIVMIIFTKVEFTKKEKVVDLGQIEINKEQKEEVAWPTYAGIGVGVLGLVLLISARGKK